MIIDAFSFTKSWSEEVIRIALDIRVNTSKFGEQKAIREVGGVIFVQSEDTLVVGKNWLNLVKCAWTCGIGLVLVGDEANWAIKALVNLMTVAGEDALDRDTANHVVNNIWFPGGTFAHNAKYKLDQLKLPTA